MELTRRYVFNNSEGHFFRFLDKLHEIMDSFGKDSVLVGMEPTGHYWFNLAYFLSNHGIKFCLVNPLHVKRSKELDDNNQTKSDIKDPLVIARLVTEGRYSFPYLPEGIYAELRAYNEDRLDIDKQMTRIMNQLIRCLDIWFPEYRSVFTGILCKTSSVILKNVCMPDAIIALGPEGINAIWREHKVRGMGMRKAKSIVAAASHSFGSKEGCQGGTSRIRHLLERYEFLEKEYSECMEKLEEICKTIPGSQEILSIKGIGLSTLVGFLSEVGDIHRFKNPRQLQKYAGLAFKELTSGKHKGKIGISKRGRKNLRYVLYLAATSVLSSNKAFAEIHEHFKYRKENPLKPKQSIIAIACKLIRVFFFLLTKGKPYDEAKMLGDISWHQEKTAQ
jgi:transposase